MVKNLPAMQETRDAGSILRSRRSPGEGNGNPLQYSCLGNRMERGAWLAAVHGVAERWDTTARAHTHTRTHTHTRVHTHTSARAHTHADTCAQTHARAHTHAHTHTRARAHTHWRAHTHTQTHARAHTHTHTHTFRGSLLPACDENDTQG